MSSTIVSRDVMRVASPRATMASSKRSPTRSTSSSGVT
jgi:hypothetical protein